MPLIFEVTLCQTFQLHPSKLCFFYQTEIGTCNLFPCLIDDLLDQFEEIGAQRLSSLQDCKRPQSPSNGSRILRNFNCDLDESLQIFESPSDDELACQEICKSVPDQCDYFYRNIDKCHLYTSNPVMNCLALAGARKNKH